MDEVKFNEKMDELRVAEKKLYTLHGQLLPSGHPDIVPLQKNLARSTWSGLEDYYLALGVALKKRKEVQDNHNKSMTSIKLDIDRIASEALVLAGFNQVEKIVRTFKDKSRTFADQICNLVKE